MEVSNTTLKAYIDTFKEYDEDPKSLIMGTNLTYEKIANAKGRVSWDQFRTITNNTFSTLGEERTLKSLRHTGVDNKELSVFNKICNATIKVETPYWFFCNFIAKAFYKNLHFEYKKIAKGHVQLKIVMNDGYSCFDNFVKAYATAFEEFPKMLGQRKPAKSIIDMSSTDPIINIYYKSSITILNPLTIIRRLFTGITNTTLLLNNIERSRHDLDILNQNLEKANEDLDHSNKLNESLIRTIMHDLNNPLAIIRLKNEKLLNSNKEFTQKDKEVINRASENMYRVIQDLRNFHLAKKVTHEENFNLVDSIKETREHFIEKIEDKKINLIIQSNLKENKTIKGNRITFINSIMSNLISNAIKFSFEGGDIKINLKEENDSITISIIDNGIGMNSNAQKNFLNNELSDSEKGTLGELGLGIGLTQVAYFIKDMGAKIQVSSKAYIDYPIEHGTVFKLIFPLNKPKLTEHLP